MLRASGYSEGENQRDLPPPPPPPLLPPPLPPLPPPSIHMRQLVLTCAQLISRSDLAAAHRLIAVLSANSSAYGDSTDRLVHSFTKALNRRIIATSTSTSMSPLLINHQLFHTSNNYNHDEAIIQSSFLSLNQITPFIRFNHLTANQAILEGIDQTNHHHHHHHQSLMRPPQEPQNIHILDFDIMHGVQWPPLMQAIADRFPPPTLRITGTGNNLNILRRTGDRLSKFAHSLGLRFRFYPLLLANTNNVENVDHLIDRLSDVIILPNETLAVNCVLYLHRMLKNRDKLCLLLRKIKSMNPRVVTLAENEANHNHPIFPSRVLEAMSYYTAIFDSLEATLPPNSRERIEVEQVWFGREIVDIVAEEGDNRKERHERYRSWEVMMRSAGFRNVQLSSYAVSQAKLLLRLHYPSEGYNLDEVMNECFFLGWKNQPLYSVSSWY